jgi:medium-chain acyl-[acyl-carrier-protein] hydrolase
VEICPVLLAGREARLREAPSTRLTPLAELIAGELEPILRGPFAIFGHSMGAWLGFEVARCLRRRYGLEPVHLYVSGRRAPHLPSALPAIHQLDGAAFLEAFQRRYQPLPDAILREPELLQLFLPTLRADLEMLETYAYNHDEPLDCPVTAFGGLRDPGVAREEVEAWRVMTSSAFRAHFLPGDHFFLQSSRTQLLQLIADGISDAL